MIVRDKYMMDGHKLLWHLDRVVQWQQGKRIAPLHIDLGITTGCNLNCIYCYGVLQGRTSIRRRFDMPKEVLHRLLKDAKELDVRSIAFVGEGENTLNEALFEGLCLAKKIDLDVGISTNGIQIDPRQLREILGALVWIRFNISAASEQSYFVIHKSKKFRKVAENIRAAVNTKEKYGLRTTIGLQMVVVKENIDEIVPVAKLGKELGVDYLVIKPCSDTYEGTLNSPHEEYLRIADLLKRAEEHSDRNYTVIVKWNKMENLGKKNFFKCYGTQFIVNISGNGTVFPCGHFFNIQKEHYKMGNIMHQSLREIVASETYWDVQRRMELINVNQDCETNCRHYYVNQFLWNLRNPPEHVNFV